MPMLLSSLLLIPFLGTLALMVWPGNPSPGRLRQITIAILVLQLAMSVVTALQFNPDQAGMQLQELHRWVPGIGLDYALGVDGLSLPLVLINGALTLVSAVITRDISKRPRLYFAMLLLISGAVNGAFLAENLLLFFLFYELELIPLWLLVSVWGGVNRAYAATKFLIFTAISGMLILGAFLGLALLTGTVDFSLTPVLSERLAMGGQLWLLGALLIGFGIKIPLVPLHNWLPDTHTQASTPVSVLLAGVLLKDEEETIAADACRLLEPQVLEMTITQGKYHQVRRMIAAAGNHVNALQRTAIGNLQLPDDLSPGEWRWLDADSMLKAGWSPR